MEQLDVFDCSPMTGDVLTRTGNIRSFISVPENWKLKNGGRKPFCIRDTAPLCGATTGCGYKRKLRMINRTALSC